MAYLFREKTKAELVQLVKRALILRKIIQNVLCHGRIILKLNN
jgi:hypothetical protein